MPVLHQEIDAVFLGCDRVWIGLGDLLKNLHMGHVKFITARSPLVRAHLALDDHARLLRESFQRVKGFRSNGVLGDHPLNESAAVPKDREQKLAALTQVIEPASDGDGLTVVLTYFCNRGYRRCHKFKFSIANCHFPREEL